MRNNGKQFEEFKAQLMEIEAAQNRLKLEEQGKQTPKWENASKSNDYLHILQHSKFIQKRAQRSLNVVVINSDSDSCRPTCQPDSLTTWLNSGPPSTEPTANFHHWNGFASQGNIFTPGACSSIKRQGFFWLIWGVLINLGVFWLIWINKKNPQINQKTPD